jgi:hypothetical protein
MLIIQRETEALRQGGQEMKARKDLFAYCGFYCGDCLGYTGVIADAAENLMEVLEKHQFHRTAECVFPEQLRDYDKLREMLGFMAGLRCAGICREGEQDDPSGCQVRNCCRDKGFYACYECDDFETCDILDSLHKGLHTDACVKNMKAIREMGLEAWLSSGKRHMYWGDVDD